MVADEAKGASAGSKPGSQRITDEQRFRYIGFDVFPGKPRDLFRSESEKQSLVKTIQLRRERHDRVRENSPLLEKRVSSFDRLIMTVGCVVILLSLFLPWYSVYNEKVIEAAPVPSRPSAMADTSLSANALTDSMGMAATTTEPPPEQAAAGSEGITRVSDNEELITSYRARVRTEKEFSEISGLGSLTAIGTVGSMVFGSGLVLMLTGVLMFVYTLSCIGLPIYSFYAIHGLSGDPDAKALKLKKMLRWNWLPILVFVFTFIISFFGAEYGFTASNYFTSLGDSYNVATFFEAVTWGIPVSFACFWLLALKGVEI